MLGSCLSAHYSVSNSVRPWSASLPWDGSQIEPITGLPSLQFLLHFFFFFSCSSFTEGQFWVRRVSHLPDLWLFLEGLSTSHIQRLHISIHYPDPLGFSPVSGTISSLNYFSLSIKKSLNFSSYSFPYLRLVRLK